MKKIGFIINPIAGMGGKVALKGTDGKEILQEAIRRGATPITIHKAKLFFEGIINLSLNEELEFIVPQGEMGEKLFLENPLLELIEQAHRYSPDKVNSSVQRRLPASSLVKARRTDNCGFILISPPMALSQHHEGAA